MVVGSVQVVGSRAEEGISLFGVVQSAEEGAGAVGADGVGADAAGTAAAAAANVNPGVRGAEDQQCEEQSNGHRGDQHEEEAVNEVLTGGGHRHGAVVVHPTAVQQRLHRLHHVLSGVEVLHDGANLLADRRLRAANGVAQTKHLHLANELGHVLKGVQRFARLPAEGIGRR